MLTEQWSAAVGAFDRIIIKNDDVRLRQRLCRNLASLQTHRKDIYRTLIDAEPGDQYRLVPSRTGAVTILAKVGDREVKMSADNDPHGAVSAVMRGIDNEWKNGVPLGLASIGDGYLLRHLAHHPPQLFLDKQHAIVLMESDPRLVLACLAIHDYTGPDGPIEQQRIRWYIGDDWQQSLREDYRNDLMLLHPVVTVRLGLDSRAIDEQSKQVLIDIGNWDRAFQTKVDAHTQTLTRDRLVDLYAQTPSRPPRVLVVTTRFSTVLQYSARDTEQGFRQNGWDTRLLIEPSPAHGMNRIAIRQAIAEFKPELIFLIDHHRAEYGDLYPKEIPFVCWVQDNLPNLTTVKAGESLETRDFALIPSVQRYINQYRYPRRQCFEFRKLTTVPVLPRNRETQGDDLVYVSNWSKTTDQLIAESIAALTNISSQAIATSAVQKVAQVYRDGGSLDSQGAVRRVIGLQMTSAAATTFLSQLHERLNVGLYRQQALSWAAEIAEQNGLSLAIHGNGWDDNPQFAKYAKGPVKYGPELESLTRRGRINLMLEPYVCIAHQRVLDGLAAGGFFLLRGNSPTTVLSKMVRLLDRHDLRDAQTLSDVRSRLQGDDRVAFEGLVQMVRDNDAAPDEFDIVTSVNDLKSAGFLGENGQLLTELHQVGFSGKEEMQRKILHYLNDAGARTRIAEVQRSEIVARFSYSSGISRLIGWLKQTLSQETLTAMRNAS